MNRKIIPLIFLLSLKILTGVAEVDHSLERIFLKPPQSAKPQTWYHWLDGNVSKEGIRLDLEAMKRVGLGGLHMFDGGFNMPLLVDRKLKYMSPEWLELVKFTAEECDRLGLELILHTCAGWNETGGTWVKPEDSMRKYVWTKTRVMGPCLYKEQVPEPSGVYGPFLNIPTQRYKDIYVHKSDYADSALVAYKVSSDIAKDLLLKPQLLSSVKDLDLRAVSDGNLLSFVKGPRQKPSDVFSMDFKYEVDFTCRSVTLYVEANGKPKGELLASTDGKTYSKVTDVPIQSSLMNAGTETVSIPEIKAKYFRLSISNVNGFVNVGEVELSPELRVANFETKAGFTLPKNLLPKTFGQTAVLKNAVKSSEVIDLTPLLKADGTLEWSAPEGEWVILRLGHSPTGKRNSPAQEGADGLESDKMSPLALKNFFEGFFSPIEKALGEQMGKGLKGLLIDSWEADCQNWTPAFIQEFTQRRGYSPLKYIPILTGVMVDNAEVSERFLGDIRRTISDLIAEAHFGAYSELAHKKGMVVYAEAAGYGMAFLGDQLQCKGRVDVPMGEFWNQNDPYSQGIQTHHWGDVKSAATAAHIYGLPLAATESFTSGASNKGWHHHPYTMKQVGDRYFSAGINRFVFHTYAHQPWVDRRPGMTFGPYGHHFSRNETWWDHGGSEWVDYLTRSQFLLQQGKFVADVCFYYGETTPVIVDMREKMLPDLAVGYDFDVINAEVLLDRLTVKEGRLTLPDGLSYRVMVLADHAAMSPRIARKIKSLVAQGAVIVGSTKPTHSPSLENFPEGDTEVQSLAAELWDTGKVISNKNVTEVLRHLSVEPDFSFVGSIKGTEANYIHRKMEGVDIYFVCNQLKREELITCSFRVQGLQPEFWDPMTGLIRPVHDYEQKGQHTVIPIKFDPAGSMFVIFRSPSSKKVSGAKKNWPETKKIMELVGPWELAFDSKWGGPAKASFSQLDDWITRSEEGIQHFSGTAKYSKKFEIDLAGLDGTTKFLNLGDVQVMAKITLNGQAFPTLWKPPFIQDISGALKSGNNLLEVEVTNLWVNRLIYDLKQTEEQRLTYLAYPLPKVKDYKPLPSGMMGPVQILIEDKNSE